MTMQKVNWFENLKKSDNQETNILWKLLQLKWRFAEFWDYLIIGLWKSELLIWENWQQLNKNDHVQGQLTFETTNFKHLDKLINHKSNVILNYLLFFWTSDQLNTHICNDIWKHFVEFWTFCFLLIWNLNKQ